MSLFVILVGVIAVSQVVSYAPLDPINLQPQPPLGPDIWISAEYGQQASDVQGLSTPVGTSTLLLNGIQSPSAVTASWSVDFASDLDYGSYAMNYTLYVPGQMAFASNQTPMSVTIAGHSFTFQPNEPTSVPWYAGTVYTPKSSDLTVLPSYFRNQTGHQLFVPFHFVASQLPPTLVVSVTLPADAQDYISYVAVAATANFSGSSASDSLPLALILLPFVAVIVVGLLWLAARLDAGAYAKVLAVALGLRLLLAPLFITSDVQTLARYPALLFNYHILDFQSWGYGLAWLGQTLLPPVPMFALGINPSLNAYNILLKVPGIVADGLVFLLLIRILTPRIGKVRAEGWALVGWLFNPMVIYFSSIHGLPESTVALALLGALWGFQTAHERWGLAAISMATLLLITSALTWPAIVFSRWLSWSKKLLLVFIPAIAYVGVFLSLYGSLSSLLPYGERLLGRGTPGTVLLGVSTTSGMSILFVVYHRFDIYLSPWYGLAAVGLACIALVWRRGLFPREWAPVALYGCLITFYFTYETFYVQHLVWILPLMLVLMALSPIRDRRGWMFIAVLSILALFINYENAHAQGQQAFLAFPLFAGLLVPGVLALSPLERWPEACAKLVLWARRAGVVMALLILGSSEITRHLSMVNEVMVGGILLAFLVLALALDRRMFRPYDRPVRHLATVGVLTLPLLLWFMTSVTFPEPVQGLEAGLVLVSMLEMGVTVIRFLRAPTASAVLSPLAVA